MKIRQDNGDTNLTSWLCQTATYLKAPDDDDIAQVWLQNKENVENTFQLWQFTNAEFKQVSSISTEDEPIRSSRNNQNPMRDVILKQTDTAMGSLKFADGQSYQDDPDLPDIIDDDLTHFSTDGKIATGCTKRYFKNVHTWSERGEHPLKG